MPDARGGSSLVLKRLAAAGFACAVAVDLAPLDLGVRVVKVLIPGFQLSDLL